MTVTIPAFDELKTMSAEKLTELRGELLGQAEALVTRSADTEMSSTDADQYRQLEQTISQVGYFAQRAQHQAAIDANPRASGVLDTIGQPAGDTFESTRRPISPIEFRGEDLRDLHGAFMAGRAGEIHALETRAAATAVPMAIVSEQILQPVITRREPTRIASLIPTVSATAPTVTYYKQSASATGADIVAEAAAKPESTPGWTAATATIRKIAHYTDVSTEALADFANFETVVVDEMKRGLVAKESSQLLSGPGTGITLTGLTVASGIQTYAPGSAEERYLSVLHAITMLRTGTTFSEPGVVLLNPSDWEKVAKTTATTGELIVTPDPTGAGPGSLWGVPMVLTTGLTAGTGLVANLADAALVFEREAATIKVDPYSQSVNNVVRIICEERIGLGVVRAASIVKITFNP